MPPRTYTNTDLRRLIPPKDEVRDVSYWTPDDPAWAGRGNATPHDLPLGPDQPVSERMAQARGSLARASHLSQEVADEQDRLAQITADVNRRGDDANASVFDSPLTRLSRLARQVARPIPAAAEKAAGVGMFLAPEVSIPSQMLLGATSARQLAAQGLEGLKAHPVQSAVEGLMVAGGLHGLGRLTSRMLPTAAERAYTTARDAFESGAPRPPAHLIQQRPLTRVPTLSDAQVPKGSRAATFFRTPKDALGKAYREAQAAGATRSVSGELAPARRLGRDLVAEADAARKRGTFVGREVPYQMREPAIDPNQVLDVARQVAAETGQPIEQVLKGYAKSGGVSREQMQALRDLAQSGRPFSPPSEIAHPSILPDVMNAEYAKNNPIFSEMARSGQFGPEQAAHSTRAYNSAWRGLKGTEELTPQRMAEILRKFQFGR